MNTVTDIETAALEAKGAFTVCVIPSSEYFASRSDPSAALTCHDTVLRPLLDSAVEVWAYELKEPSEALEYGRSILIREAGKYRIRLGGDPITGHERFWNAAGGARGSIAFVFEPAAFPAARILPHCDRVFVVNNPSTPHSPAAMRFAKATTSRGNRIVAMLSRTNGLQWLSIHGCAEQLVPLFSLARSLTQGSGSPPPVPAS